MPEGTQFAGVILKQFLVGLLAFSLGALTYRALYERIRGRGWLVAAFVGLMLVFIPLGELIIRTPLVRPTWEAIMFTVGTALASVGFLVDALKNRRG